MRTDRKAQATSTEIIRLFLGKMQRGLAKSRFRAQGIETEMNV
jgi:hypothetical protein